ncbi:PTS sugar transporter subunit IIA [Weissella paramesenteroides]
MLALKEAHAQLGMLQTLVALIQNESKIQQLLLAKNAEEIIETLKSAGIK